MNYLKRKLIKTSAVALAVVGILTGGSVALADTSSDTIKVTSKGVLGIPGKKTNKTRKDAVIKMNTAIPWEVTILVNIKNKYGNVANAEAVSFTSSAVGDSKDITYKGDKGKEGNDFRPYFGLTSATGHYTEYTINYTFTP